MSFSYKSITFYPGNDGKKTKNVLTTLLIIAPDFNTSIATLI